MVFLFGITASTFAWFKINSNASVSGFEFTVQGGEGYQISIDGKKYYSNLSHKQMVNAILKGYRSNYVIDGDEIYNNPTYSETGDLVSLGNAMTEEEINNAFSSILLKPLSPITTSDGSLKFRNYIKNEVLPSSGSFIEFSLYFKTFSDKESDNQSYSVYVLGENISSELNNEAAPRTSIKTIGNGDNITLRANMNAISNLDSTIPFENRNLITYGPSIVGKTSINVFTANAIRFSIGNEHDENFKNDANYICSNQIYEISDDVAYDLGSYATNYDDYIATNNSTYSVGDSEYVAYSDLEHNLYDCNSNAQFTYYNNLRTTAQVPMNYLEKPNTIRHLTTVRENNDENSIYKNTIHYITTVKSGEEAHKLTFRFWLEGYDADCFDQIKQSIRVNLSFGSVKN